jgi:hypothetical protein
MLRKPLFYAIAAFITSFVLCAILFPAFLIEQIRGSDYEGWRSVDGAVLDMYLCPLICAAGGAWIGWNRRIKNSQD